MTVTVYSQTPQSPVPLPGHEKVRQLAIAIKMMESIRSYAHHAAWRSYRLDPRNLRTTSGLVLKCQRGAPFMLGTPLGSMSFPIAVLQPYKGSSYWDLMDCTPFKLNDMYVAPYEDSQLYAINSFRREDLPKPGLIRGNQHLTVEELISLDEEAQRLMPQAWELVRAQQAQKQAEAQSTTETLEAEAQDD